mmetsp:Transcript_103405/g.323285  ORF Transcript_103405/g.323285 Transcript_103405/m.323285 type:complete len:288 (+) Transcript_103405:919-1782(+)
MATPTASFRTSTALTGFSRPAKVMCRAPVLRFQTKPRPSSPPLTAWVASVRTLTDVAPKGLMPRPRCKGKNALTKYKQGGDRSTPQPTPRWSRAFSAAFLPRSLAIARFSSIAAAAASNVSIPFDTTSAALVVMFSAASLAFLRLSSTLLSASFLIFSAAFRASANCWLMPWAFFGGHPGVGNGAGEGAFFLFVCLGLPAVASLSTRSSSAVPFTSAERSSSEAANRLPESLMDCTCSAWYCQLRYFSPMFRNGFTSPRHHFVLLMQWLQALHEARRGSVQHSGSTL